MTLWLLFAPDDRGGDLRRAVAARARRARRRRAGSDIAVYRDQLDEIARDRAAGLIGEAEAEAARVEVSRRLIAAADAAPAESSCARAATFRRRVAGAGRTDRAAADRRRRSISRSARRNCRASRSPAAIRVPLQDRSLDRLVAQVEAHLEKNPEDGRGWEVVGPVYMRHGRFDDAVKARRNSLRLNGPSAEREADLGESLVAAANGVVTAEAKAAFERALTHDARNNKARFLLGVAAQQDGQPAKAAAIWRAMLEDIRPGSPWIPMVREALAQFDPSGAAPSASAPGPTAEDVAAANADEAGRPQRHGARHGRAAGRAAEAATARTSKAGCGWCAPIRYWATATARCPRWPTRAARSVTMPTSFAGLMSW